MRKIIKSCLMACSMLLLSNMAALAQPAPCDPASPPNTVGSCQFANITFPNGGPDCYVCQAGTPNTCVPNDSFCDGMSGGTESNDCRVGECLVVTVSDPNNPSGCNYDLDTGASTDCRNCIPEGLATLENCGNGICEPDEGEACDTCDVDCLLPGFTDTCPLTTGTIIGQACSAPQPPSITFDGPPYNVPFSQECEDGDLCTDNTCAAAAAPLCDSTPKVCSINLADFCCPADCSPPAAGTQCGPNDNGCDIDCYIPEDCIPTPSPIPTPTPPVFTGCLEGSGVFGSKKSGPGCGGFSCTLNPLASGMADLGVVLSLAGILGFGAIKGSRKRPG